MTWFQGKTYKPKDFHTRHEGITTEMKQNDSFVYSVRLSNYNKPRGKLVIYILSLISYCVILRCMRKRTDSCIQSK